MAENKVVIKINYDKDKNLRPMAEPKMVTVWHARRILTAAAILAILVGIPIFWFSGGDQGSDELDQTEYTEKEQPLNKADQVIQGSGIAVGANQTVTPVADNVKQNRRKSEVVEALKRPAAIIYTKKVVRASLNSGPKDKEPYQLVKLPVRLAQNQKIDLFYFTELRNIQDGVLYHYWSKDGRTVDKKQLNIKDSSAKVLSGRTLSYKDKGEWQIQLIDKKGKIFSEVNFLVNPE